ncbi:hypothetical protein L1887_54410 [Cichorium endivia]|nr:hypothetical protein L1887_54410 [Cichorium endivia]
MDMEPRGTIITAASCAAGTVPEGLVLRRRLSRHVQDGFLACRVGDHSCFSGIAHESALPGSLLGLADLIGRAVVGTIRTSERCRRPFAACRGARGASSGDRTRDLAHLMHLGLRLFESLLFGLIATVIFAIVAHFMITRKSRSSLVHLKGETISVVLKVIDRASIAAVAIHVRDIAVSLVVAAARAAVARTARQGLALGETDALGSIVRLERILSSTVSVRHAPEIQLGVVHETLPLRIKQLCTLERVVVQVKRNAQTKRIILFTANAEIPGCDIPPRSTPQ